MTERVRSEKKRGWAIKLKDIQQREGEDKYEGLSEYCLPGVRQINLIPTIQDAIGCLIGEDITSDSPFIEIRKEIIKNHMATPDQKSPFLPLQQELSDYHEDTVLIGYDPSTGDKENFYVCVTSDAKQEVQSILEKHKEEQKKELMKRIVRRPKPWKSMGSEVEIDDMIVQNFRPLLQVKLVSKRPLHSARNKFSMRKVEDATDGYVALLPGEHKYNNILKKRIDTATQVVAYTTHSEAQTNPTYPQNKWTQYSFKYAQAKEAPPTSDENVSIKDQVEELLDNIRVNENINFHIDDYKELSKGVLKPVSTEIHQRNIFHDVVLSKGKKVSCVLWHPSRKDLFIAAYVSHSLTEYMQQEPKKDSICDASIEKKRVLVWSEKDNLKPKLCLESHRYVTVLSICERKDNIVICGCENGDLVIWDLNGRLDTKDDFEVSNKKNRIIIESAMNWMKDISDVPSVSPTVVSARAESHKQAITGISWLSQNWYITPIGNVEYGAEINSLQFLTCSLDGTVFVWDLYTEPSQRVAPKVSSSRLKKLPRALCKPSSWLKPLNRVLAPIFKLLIKNPIPLSCISIRETIHEPEIEEPGPEEVQDELYYVPPTKEKKPEFKIALLLGTSTGDVLVASWKGYDPEENHQDNKQICLIIPKSSIHDGPVRTCCRNPKRTNLILTVGGNIFMLWDENHTEALLWRKSEVEYVSGTWSQNMFSIFFLCRVDGYLEFWNSHIVTSRPSYIICLIHHSIVDFTTMNNKLILTDNSGGVHVLKAPEILTIGEEEESRKSEVSAMTRNERKLKLHEWITKELEKVPIKMEKKQESTNLSDKKNYKDVEVEQQDEFDIILDRKWKNAQEEFMCNALLQRKKLNLEKLSERSIPLKRTNEENRKLQLQEEESIANKDKLIAYARNELLFEELLKQRKEIILEPMRNRLEVKKSYLSSYKFAANNAQEIIKRNPFDLEFNWIQFFAEGRKLRKMYNVATGRVSIHEVRYDEECRKKKETLIKAGTFIEKVSKLQKAAVSAKLALESLQLTQVKEED